MAEGDDFTRKDWLRLLVTVVWLVIFIFWPGITLGITFIIIDCVAIAYNAMIFWETVIRKGHASSVVPLFGGLFVVVGIMFLPISESWRWAWIPIVVDWGGIPGYVAGIVGYRS